MQGKTKIIVAIIIVLVAFYYVLPLFYETFNYSPSMEEGQPYRRSVLVWSALTNQRVTLNTEIPSMPVNRLPIYQGRSSSSVLNVSFTSSVEAYNNCTEDICFLVKNNEITESRFNSSHTLIDLQPVQLTELNNSGAYIIQQVRGRNFLTPEGNFPISSSGRTRIVAVKFVYFNGFHTYPYRYVGKTKYYPAWKLTVETADYGNKELMIKAF